MEGWRDGQTDGRTDGRTEEGKFLPFNILLHALATQTLSELSTLLNWLAYWVALPVSELKLTFPFPPLPFQHPPSLSLRALTPLYCSPLKTTKDLIIYKNSII